MISLSHWGMFDPAHTAVGCAAPIEMISDIYRIHRAMAAFCGISGSLYAISGTHIVKSLPN